MAALFEANNELLPAQNLRGHLKGVDALAGNDAYVFSGGRDRTVKVWRAATGEAVATLGSAPRPSDDNAAESGAWDAVTRRHMAGLGVKKIEVEAPVIVSHTGSITAIAVSRDSILFAGSADRTVSAWDLRTHVQLATLDDHAGTVHALCVTAGGTLYSGGGDGAVFAYKAATRAKIHVLDGHGGAWILALAATNGVLFSSGRDAAVRAWRGSELAAELSAEPPAVAEVLAVRGAELFAGYEDGQIRIWDAASFSCKQTLEGHGDGVCGLAVSGSALFSADGVEIRCWDTATGACAATAEADGAEVLAYAGGVLYSAGPDDTAVAAWLPPRDLR